MNNLFTQNGKTKPETLTLQEKSLYPVASPRELFDNLYYEALFDKIVSLVGRKLYEIHYTPLINKFAEFAQILPSNQHGRLGSLLQEGLQRAYYAIEAYHQEKEIPEPIWDYVLFSSALLFDVAKISEEQTIVISLQNGEFKRKWLPQNGSLLDQQAEHYKIRSGGGHTSWVSRHVTMWLAYLIMPTDGFAWIFEKTLPFSVWVALLSDDSAVAGSFGLILDRAKESLEQFRKLNLGLQLPFTPTNPEDYALGEEFINWLKAHLQDGSITVNQNNSKVHVLMEGVFLSAQLFRDFSRWLQGYKGGFVGWQAVLWQFTRLGYTPIGEETKLDQFTFKKSVDIQGVSTFLGGNFPQSQNKEGILVKESAWLLGNKTLEVSDYVELNSSPQLAKVSLPSSSIKQ